LKKKPPSHYSKGRFKRLTWEEFIARKELLPIDTHLFTDRDGNLMVDRILRYENLREELQQVLGKPDFKIYLDALPNRHKFTRTFKIDPSEAEVERIYEAFAESNRYTGYNIEDYRGGGAR